MISLTIVGCIVPYNDPNLLNGSSSTDANASPFVLAVKNAGITAVPSIMNVRDACPIPVQMEMLTIPGRHFDCCFERRKLLYLRIISYPCCPC